MSLLITLSGTLEKFGLDYDTLAAINPGVIFYSITRFSETGPYTARYPC